MKGSTASAPREETRTSPATEEAAPISKRPTRALLERLFVAHEALVTGAVTLDDGQPIGISMRFDDADRLVTQLATAAEALAVMTRARHVDRETIARVYEDVVRAVAEWRALVAPTVRAAQGVGSIERVAEWKTATSLQLEHVVASLRELLLADEQARG